METKLLTYAEAGEALGIAAASAKRLANRRKWPKTIGNDGLSRVHVPLERLEAARDSAGDDAGDGAEDVPSADTKDISHVAPRADTGDVRALVAVLESRIAELQGRVADLDTEARAGRATIAELTARAGRVDLVEALLEAERRHAGDLKAERDRLLDRALAPPPAGLMARLKQVLAG